MTLLEAITEAHLLAQGKATAPGNTTTKYLALKSLSNVVQRMWQDEPDVQWDSLKFTAIVVATVSATDTFALPATVREVSKLPEDKVFITHVDGAKSYFNLVEENELQGYGRRGMRVVAKRGQNLVFSIAFTTTDAQFGGVISVPSYAFVASLTTETDNLQVDNPLWATLMMASEYCRTKTSLRSRVDELVERAGQEMTKMKQAQMGSISEAIAEPIALGRSW